MVDGYDEYFSKMLQKAENILYEALFGVMRTDGTMIAHSERVSECLKTDTLKIVALLHDVLEDSDWTSRMLLDRGISKSLVESVKALTHNKEDSYLDYLMKVKKDYNALRVKIEDMKDNLNGATGNRRTKYLLGLYILTGENYSNSDSDVLELEEAEW